MKSCNIPIIVLPATSSGAVIRSSVNEAKAKATKNSSDRRRNNGKSKKNSFANFNLASLPFKVLFIFGVIVVLLQNNTTPSGSQVRSRNARALGEYQHDNGSGGGSHLFRGRGNGFSEPPGDFSDLDHNEIWQNRNKGGLIPPDHHDSHSIVVDPSVPSKPDTPPPHDDDDPHKIKPSKPFPSKPDTPPPHDDDDPHKIKPYQPVPSKPDTPPPFHPHRDHPLEPVNPEDPHHHDNPSKSHSRRRRDDPDDPTKIHSSHVLPIGPEDPEDPDDPSKIDWGKVFPPHPDHDGHHPNNAHYRGRRSTPGDHDDPDTGKFRRSKTERVHDDEDPDDPSMIHHSSVPHVDPDDDHHHPGVRGTPRRGNRYDERGYYMEGDDTIRISKTQKSIDDDKNGRINRSVDDQSEEGNIRFGGRNMPNEDVIRKGLQNVFKNVDESSPEGAMFKKWLSETLGGNGPNQGRGGNEDHNIHFASANQSIDEDVHDPRNGGDDHKFNISKSGRMIDEEVHHYGPGRKEDEHNFRYINSQKITDEHHPHGHMVQGVGDMGDANTHSRNRRNAPRGNGDDDDYKFNQVNRNSAFKKHDDDDDDRYDIHSSTPERMPDDDDIYDPGHHGHGPGRNSGPSGYNGRRPTIIGSPYNPNMNRGPPGGMPYNPRGNPGRNQGPYNARNSSDDETYGPGNNRGENNVRNQRLGNVPGPYGNEPLPFGCTKAELQEDLTEDELNNRIKNLKQNATVKDMFILWNQVLMFERKLFIKTQEYIMHYAVYLQKTLMLPTPIRMKYWWRAHYNMTDELIKKERGDFNDFYTFVSKGGGGCQRWDFLYFLQAKRKSWSELRDLMKSIWMEILTYKMKKHSKL
ncbi:phist protein [Plasmodium ovale curtisi]|uniref:Phist protein n=1 Tax=Plasmodium ovale curtisi TaxID=864141 RepID=A0A1A8VIK1_PLAOA|nr:phist protein [Plasmodium ovale curtisi]